MGETKLTLEFLDRRDLKPEEQILLDEILSKSYKYVELPWPEPQASPLGNADVSEPAPLETVLPDTLPLTDGAIANHPAVIPVTSCAVGAPFAGLHHAPTPLPMGVPPPPGGEGTAHPGEQYLPPHLGPGRCLVISQHPVYPTQLLGHHEVVYEPLPSGVEQQHQLPPPPLLLEKSLTEGGGHAKRGGRRGHHRGSKGGGRGVLVESTQVEVLETGDPMQWHHHAHHHAGAAMQYTTAAQYPTPHHILMMVPATHYPPQNYYSHHSHQFMPVVAGSDALSPLAPPASLEPTTVMPSVAAIRHPPLLTAPMVTEAETLGFPAVERCDIANEASPAGGITDPPVQEAPFETPAEAVLTDCPLTPPKSPKLADGHEKEEPETMQLLPSVPADRAPSIVVLTAAAQESSPAALTSTPATSSVRTMEASPAAAPWSTPMVNGGTHRSWADLFKGNSTPSGESGAPADGGSSPLREEPAREEEVAPGGEAVLRTEEDELELSLGRALHNHVVNHMPPSIQPRGLENGKNWCYINANLQALLACPAFYNLIYNLPLVPGMQRVSSRSPLIECLLYFLHTYSAPLIMGAGKKKDEVVIGSTYNPEAFRNYLVKIKPDCKMGKQEDAEEFLSFVLNGLHDEMVSLMRTVQNGVNGQCNGSLDGDQHKLEDEAESGAWRTMGHRNKNLVTRSADYLASPVREIFGGVMRSCVTADGESSASLQPFFTLQLDIQDGVTSVEDALAHLAAEESVQNYYSSKSNQETEAQRRTTLEKLPQVLILHLKRFVYDKNGGCKKLMNNISIPQKLELDRRLLSKERLQMKRRSYQLFAVLSHSGERTDKGHYVTDAYHPSGRIWLRCDDESVTPISQSDLLRFETSLLPYLLFYRRLDTLMTSR